MPTPQVLSTLPKAKDYSQTHIFPQGPQSIYKPRATNLTTAQNEQLICVLINSALIWAELVVRNQFRILLHEAHTAY